MARSKAVETEAELDGEVTGPSTVDPTALVFGEPPAVSSRGPRSDMKPIVAALSARPGEWAKIVTNASQSVAARWRKAGLEVRAEKLDDTGHRVDLWARYVEPEAETDAAE